MTWLGLGRIAASLTKIDAFNGLTNRPAKVSSAVNYLIAGSDTREGLSKEELKKLRVGSTKTAAGKRSDTILLVHISKARDRAVIVSIPRDTFALIPEHTGTTGKKIPPQYSKINSSFAWGGAPLLIQTVENMTSVRIDHYVEVNFTGFVRMVDALGGIEICTKRDINDPKSYLVLPAGRHNLGGIDALRYVRSRDFDGLGDLGRMKRQQQFIGAMLRKATSVGVLLNPVKLLDFVSSGLKTVTTDPGLNQSDLITLGKELRNLSAKNVRTLTVPLKFYNYNSKGVTSAVLWDPVLAPELFDRIKKDSPLLDQMQASPSATPIDKFKSGSAADDPCSSGNG